MTAPASERDNGWLTAADYKGELICHGCYSGYPREALADYRFSDEHCASCAWWLVITPGQRVRTWDR